MSEIKMGKESETDYDKFINSVNKTIKKKGFLFYLKNFFYRLFPITSLPHIDEEFRKKEQWAKKFEACKSPKLKPCRVEQVTLNNKLNKFEGNDNVSK